MLVLIMDRIVSGSEGILLYSNHCLCNEAMLIVCEQSHVINSISVDLDLTHLLVYNRVMGISSHVKCYGVKSC